MTTAGVDIAALPEPNLSLNCVLPSTETEKVYYYRRYFFIAAILLKNAQVLLLFGEERMFVTTNSQVKDDKLHFYIKQAGQT